MELDDLWVDPERIEERNKYLDWYYALLTDPTI